MVSNKQLFLEKKLKKKQKKKTQPQEAFTFRLLTAERKPAQRDRHTR